MYDVSRGKTFYGPGRSYHHYVGRDATRSFATGCTEPECLTSSLVGLSETQKQEAYRWLELYEHHDKYAFVGKIRVDPVHDLVEQALLEEETLAAARSAESEFGGGPDATYRSVNDKAKALYVGGRFDEAISHWKTALVLLGEAREVTPVAEVLERADILVSMAALAQKRRRFSEADDH